MECCHPKEDNHKKGDLYTCPMHPEILEESPGMCPECGMSLVPTKAHVKNKDDAHKGHSSTDLFKRKFWISLLLTIPVILYSALAEKVLGITLPIFPGSYLIGPILGTIVFFYGGLVFLSSAWREIKGRLPGMMTLIAIAIIAAYTYSMGVTLFGDGKETLFFELTSLITIMLLGHWIEMRAVQGAQGALKELSKLLPDTADVIRDGNTQTISLEELRVGDMVRIRPGSKVPADGTIIEGQSTLNESVITGESKPVDKKVGDEVVAGTINGDGSITVRVDRIGDNTFLAGVMRLVKEAQASKSRLQILSDKAALLLTIVAVTIGVITFSTWLLVGAGIVVAVTRLVAVLIIACPHALGLAVPLVASISTTKAANNGFLVKQRLALEVARNIDTVLFDKTGTLTKGEFGVAEILTLNNSTYVLQVATSLNIHSEHPLAHAMVVEAEKQKVTLVEVKEFKRIPGKGVEGIVNEKKAVLGNEILLNDFGASLPDDIQKKVSELSIQGKTVVHLAIDGIYEGSIALSDIIREESREAIRILHERGISVAMVTGDGEDVANWVSKELEIDEYFAGVLPHQKRDKVKILQSQGKKVAMVGDGVNDAPALMQADLGIAIGAGTNVAIESAGIILVRDDPRDIPKIMKLSRLTYRKMLQNIWWAAGYNIIAIPLAAGAFAWAGIVLEPAVGAILMSLSTVIVAFNAVLLRKQEL